jgi:hypothetical protein
LAQTGDRVCAGNIYGQDAAGTSSTGIVQTASVAADDSDTDNTMARRAAPQVSILVIRQRSLADGFRKVGRTTSIGVRKGGI